MKNIDISLLFIRFNTDLKSRYTFRYNIHRKTLYSNRSLGYAYVGRAKTCKECKVVTFIPKI